MHPMTRHATAPLALLAAALLLGCGPEQSTRFKDAQTQKGPAVSKSAVEGKTLNQFFPKAEGDFDVVFTTEKPGNAAADLKKGGDQVALLSITDLVGEEASREKFHKSEDKLNDKYPLVAQGALENSVLVADRYQVKVRTAAGKQFSADERKEWLKKFNLAGLESHQ